MNLFVCQMIIITLYIFNIIIFYVYVYQFKISTQSPTPVKFTAGYNGSFGKKSNYKE